MGYMTLNNHKLCCYASGDGALSFCWEFEGKAEGREPTESEIKLLLGLERNKHLAHMQLKKICHQWKLVDPVERVAPDKLRYVKSGLVVRYEIGSFVTTFRADDDGHRIVNVNMLSSLYFFLGHEQELMWG